MPAVVVLLDGAVRRLVFKNAGRGDLAKLSNPPPEKVLNSWDFIDEIAARL
ncbi:hypothetical protein [Treponema sp. R6D11]